MYNHALDALKAHSSYIVVGVHADRKHILPKWWFLNMAYEG
jgi:hypothetical protein